MVGTHLFKIKKESYIIYMGIFCKGKERLTLEIERINENTIKLYISYLDIEDRGFDREEIWFNREKSEQLFWQMMEEIKEQEDLDRKSTRLNSSHVAISYAVFCLKKKKKKKKMMNTKNTKKRKNITAKELMHR